MAAERIKVLLVEDNPSDARLIQESLTEASDAPFDLETADTLAGGLRRLSAGGVDAMLLDLALPDSCGQETFIRAKAQALGVAIIILTGLNDDSLALKLVQGGAQDFVAKVDVSGNNLTRAILYAIERQRLEQEYHRLNEQLEQRVRERTTELELANRHLEAFSYSVSHDLRAPLQNIVSCSELLLLKFGEVLGEEGRKRLRGVCAHAEHMGNLIGGLLGLGRVLKADLNRVPVNLSLMAQAVAQELRETQPERAVEWIIPSGLRAVGDQVLLRAVLTNLLGNAWKFTSKRLDARIEFGKMEEPALGPVFFVKDNGAGFEMKSAEKLFGVFQRLHKQDDFPGTGVGLATVQRIIVRHGGQIWAESHPGAETSFFFTLDSPKQDATSRDALLDECGVPAHGAIREKA